jgi:hypothetical protein
LAGFAQIQSFCAKFHRASFQGLVEKKAPIIRDFHPRSAAADPAS